METLLTLFGAKWCCVFASTCGGLTNGLVHKWMGWLWELKNVGIAAVVGWIAAEFFIPALMKQFEFGVEVALAIAFMIGYSGIRLLPKLEKQVFKRISKIGGESPDSK
jgi:hypothetical protein|tara:strand:+ start:262 stop:585 length:324 start_codon:yes stop_codon:yes gene_type:complete